MANGRISYDFTEWNASTVSAATERFTGLGASNVLLNKVSLPWETSADTGQWIKFDLGSAVDIKCLGIFQHNLTAAATVTLEANATDSWGAPSYSSALTVATNADGVALKRIVKYLDESYRWWRITFEDGANPDGYISVGAIRGGDYWEFNTNFTNRGGISYLDPSEGEQFPGQVADFRELDRYRRALVQFELFDDTQREKFEAVFLKIGHSQPCILSLDPANKPTKQSMYCYLETPLDLIFTPALDYYNTAQLIFEEKTR